MTDIMGEKPETISFYWKRLPHWEVARGRYFVTIRLKGAIPQSGLKRIRRIREQVDAAIANGQDGLLERRAVFREMEYWLHRSHTVTHLRNPQVAEMVVEAFEHRVRNGIWTLFSYVVMPNHVHAFFRLGVDGDGALGPSAPTRRAGDNCHGALGPSAPTRRAGDDCDARALLTLENTLHEFKNWTARRANKLLGRNGQFWQREWFDHWSRSLEQDEEIERYIRENPVKGGLVTNQHVWPWAK